MSSTSHQTSHDELRREQLWLAALGGLLLIAAFTRFETLAQRPLWGDEIFALRTVRSARSAAEVWMIGQRDLGQHPPLHYFLMYWIEPWARPIVSMRVPSALCGVAYVAVLAGLGRALFGRRVGLLAGLMAALSVYHINYSQEARAYSLLILLTVCQFGLFYAALERLRVWQLPAFVACGAMSVYAHHIGLVNQAVLGVLAGSVAAIGLVERARSASRNDGRNRPTAAAAMLGGLVAIGVLYLPQLDWFLTYLRAPEHFEATQRLALSPRFFYDLLSRWGSGDGWIAIVFGLFFLAGASSVLARRDVRSGLVLWFAAPLLLFVLVPFSKFFSIRYAMTALPAFTLLSALGAVRLADGFARAVAARGGWPRRRVSASALLIAVLTLSIAQLSAYALFRTTTIRCSTFYRDASVLLRDKGFCGRFIVLNSLNPNAAYLLRRPSTHPE